METLYTVCYLCTIAFVIPNWDKGTKKSNNLSELVKLIVNN